MTFKENVDAEMNVNWIASYPKSGNTWMRAFLNAYYLDSQIDINDMGPICQSSDTTGMYHRLVMPFNADAEKIDPICRLMFRHAALATQIVMNISEKWGRLDTKYRFIKTHSARMVANDIHTLPLVFLNKTIYIVRDPRDVAVSWSRHFAVNKKQAIEAMSHTNEMLLPGNGSIQVLGSWDVHVKSWLNTPNTCIVRYEDMLEQPEKVFKEVLEFLEWDYDEERVKRALQNTEFNVLQQQEQENDFIERKGKKKFFYNGTVGEYENSLSKTLIKEIEDKNQEMMKKFNYL